MRSMVTLLIVLFAGIGTGFIAADDVPTKKVALLVGVNRYLKPGFRPLAFAEADVTAVAEELKRLGFQVTVLLGSGEGRLRATKANIEAAAREMVAPLGQEDIALVMLSGHGQQLSDDPDDAGLEGSESYYCPVDAVVNTPATQISLGQLLDEVLAPNVGRKLLLVDACRDIPEDRTRGRNTKGVEGRIVALPEDTAVFFSCRAGQTSFERDELGHGLFTYCLLEGLREKAATASGDITWARLVAHVNERMVEEDLRAMMPPRLRQVPIPAGSMPHTILGRLAPGAIAPTTPTVPARSKMPEEMSSQQLEMIRNVLKLQPVHLKDGYTLSDRVRPEQCRLEVVRGEIGSAWVLFDSDGRKLREFSDTNGDNVVDEWTYFLNGVVVYRDRDTNGSNRVDEVLWFVDGRPSRRGFDKDEDGAIDSEVPVDVP